jgi:hypothetical protein
MRRLLLVFSCCMAINLVGTAGFADSIGPNCGTCSGSIYTLTYSPISTNKYQVTYTVDTSGYKGGGTLLDDVAFKVSSHDPTSVSLVSAPNGAANWTTYSGGINAGGCDSHGGGFVCAAANSLSSAASVPDGTYAWMFDIVTTGLSTGSFESSVKARYTNSNGRKVGALLSEDITLQDSQPSVPEPSSLLLFSLAFAGFGFLSILRRRLPAF